jgi:hypothetical protein
VKGAVTAEAADPEIITQVPVVPADILVMEVMEVMDSLVQTLQGTALPARGVAAVAEAAVGITRL